MTIEDHSSQFSIICRLFFFIHAIVGPYDPRYIRGVVLDPEGSFTVQSHLHTFPSKSSNKMISNSDSETPIWVPVLEVCFRGAKLDEANFLGMPSNKNDAHDMIGADGGGCKLHPPSTLRPLTPPDSDWRSSGTTGNPLYPDTARRPATNTDYASRQSQPPRRPHHHHTTTAVAR
jgi:hypothetical protein